MSIFTILDILLETFLNAVTNNPFDYFSSITNILSFMATSAIYLKVLAPYTVSMLFKNAFLFFMIVVFYFFIAITVSFIPGKKKIMS